VALQMFTTTDARDWPAFVSLIHPDAEIELRSQPGRMIHGRAEMEAFARSTIGHRVAHQATVYEIAQIGENAVAAIGRLNMTDEAGTQDVPIGWLMLFEDGMLRWSRLVPLDCGRSGDAGRSPGVARQLGDRGGRHSRRGTLALPFAQAGLIAALDRAAPPPSLGAARLDELLEPVHVAADPVIVQPDGRAEPLEQSGR
jgi:hypothetical protein